MNFSLRGELETIFQRVEAHYKLLPVDCQSLNLIIFNSWSGFIAKLSLRRRCFILKLIHGRACRLTKFLYPVAWKSL